MSADETWRASALSPLYEVSDRGNVRRVWAKHSRPLKPYVGHHDYLKVQLGYRGKRVYVHTLVALTFLGPRPVGHHVDHVDFDRRNNRLSNLRYLPGPVNSVRWANRVNGRNVWELISHLEAPDEHAPMTDQERDAYYEELASNW